MESRIAELRYKEVISVEDGSRYGYVGDMEVDLETGQVRLWWSPAGGGFSAFWAGRRIRSSPGPP